MSSTALRILIVEDQVLIAKQLEFIVTSAGFLVVGTAGTYETARAAAIAESPDIAFVDISLSDGSTGIEVADFLARHCAAHVVFATANRRRIPADFGGAVGVVEKPFTRIGVTSALDFMASRIQGSGGRRASGGGRESRAGKAKPDSLLLSPRFTRQWEQSSP